MAGVPRPRDSDRQAARRSRRVSPNAASPAPGLQKQPVRSEMPAALESRDTPSSSITRPSGSRKFSATVPPRAIPVGGPYTRTIGAPELCRIRPRQSSSHEVTSNPASPASI
jgi:hypothetical protein